jgi:hypothetical protein
MHPYQLVLRQQEAEDTMMRLFPMTWAALNVGLASVATYLLCSTDLLDSAVVFLIR